MEISPTKNFAIEALKKPSISAKSDLSYWCGNGKTEGSKRDETTDYTMFPVGHKVGSKRLLSDAAKREDAIQVGIRVWKVRRIYEQRRSLWTKLGLSRQRVG